MGKAFDYNMAFWRMRSQRYNGLEWANHRLYLDAFVEAALLWNRRESARELAELRGRSLDDGLEVRAV